MLNNIKRTVALLFAKAVKAVLKLLGRGATTAPGRAALYIKPDILRDLSRGVKVIIITGTNGKTTTAAMIEQGLKAAGKSCFINRSGANLITGITASFVNNANMLGKTKAQYAIVECDENALKRVSLYLNAEILVVTNIFRDQLDRYGEVMSTLAAIETGVRNMGRPFLVLNADDPMVFSLHSLGAGYTTFSLEMQLNMGGMADECFCRFCGCEYFYSYKTYAHLGAFYCKRCGYGHEKGEYSVTRIIEITGEYSLVEARLGAENTVLKIGTGGIYNIYNAIAAAAVLSKLGAEKKDIQNALAGFSGAFGRMESFGKIKMLLVKNPVGLTQSINYIYSMKADNLIFVLNDKSADGRDVSWIWDADIKIGSSVKKIYTFGTRSGDMALRLKYGGYSAKIIKSKKEFYAVCESGPTIIAATYTAMMEIRPYFAKKYRKREFWQ
ncbi:MAG: MurT ligase domain-containing protein [Clostridiales bacterium]|nr:MurT ligase domain-containing protein [Clostridiales bacterium]